LAKIALFCLSQSLAHAGRIVRLARALAADLALVPPLINTRPLPDYDRLDYGMTIGISDVTPALHLRGVNKGEI
jgi:hypothetical protein